MNDGASRSWHYVDTGGVFHDAWVIPYALLAIGLGLYLLAFLRRLQSDTRNRLILAGVVYVGAAVGVEMIEGYYQTNIGRYLDGTYAVLAGIEETLELVGILIFLDSVLRHLIRHVGVARVNLAPAVDANE